MAGRTDDAPNPTVVGIRPLGWSNPAASPGPSVDAYSRALPAAANPVPLESVAPNASPLPLASAALGRIGNYELLGEIARGGMGIVYRARQTTLNRLVALKTMRAGALPTREQAQRFQAEAEAAAKLDHANIVPIYEVGEEHGLHFYSMPLIEGDNLARRLESTPMSARESAAFVHKLALAVAYAHDRGVVHRDLKPENVLLGADGEPKITDFGLAKTMDSDESLTMTGEIVGTPNYMAPEQAAGSRNRVGPASDIYALGVLLYQMVAGRVPFVGNSPMEVVVQVLNAEPVPPRKVRPTVPVDLDTICIRCMQKSPGRRYPSARALADDLRRYLDGQAILARRETTWEKSLRWGRRNPLAAFSLAATALATIMALGVFSWSYLQIERALAAEASQRTAADNALIVAQHNQRSERRERYLANIASAASALQLQNGPAAKRALDAAPVEHRGWEWRHLYAQLGGEQFVINAGPRHSIYSPAFVAPFDGRSLFIGAFDGSVQRWDVLSERLLASQPGHTSPICTMAVSPLSHRLATLSNDGTLRLLDLESFSLINTTQAQGVGVGHLAFDPRGQRILSAGGGGGGVRLWNSLSGAEVCHSFGPPTVRCMAAAPDGSVVAVASGEQIELRNAVNGQLLRRLSGHKATVVCLDFSPDSRLLASSSDYPEATIRVWRVHDGGVAAKLLGHRNAVVRMVFSGDGQRLASSSFDQTIRLWNLANGNKCETLTGHSDGSGPLAFGGDGVLLLSGSKDETARLWDAVTGAPLAVLRGHTAAVEKVGFSLDSRLAVTSSHDGTVRIWNAQQYRSLLLRGHESYIYDVAFSPDGRSIATAAWDGTARIWDVDSGKTIHTLRHVAPIVSTVSFDATGKRLVTYARTPRSGDSRYSVVWNAKTGTALRSIQTPPSKTAAARAVFLPASESILVAENPRPVLWFDKSTGDPGQPFAADCERAFDIAFAPDGSIFATADPDHVVKLWETTSRRLLAELGRHDDVIERIAFDRSGQWLASASKDKTVRLWDTAKRKPGRAFTLGSAVYGVAFSPGGARIAAGCADNTVRLLDVEAGREVVELRGHDAYVHAVAYSPDGTRLASASGDYTVRIWDTLNVRQRTLAKGEIHK